jgi:YesN/AraC family two-component response regulator
MTPSSMPVPERSARVRAPAADPQEALGLSRENELDAALTDVVMPRLRQLLDSKP